MCYNDIKVRPPSGGRASFEEVRGGGVECVAIGSGFSRTAYRNGFVMVESRNGLDYVRSDGTGTSEFRRKEDSLACVCIEILGCRCVRVRWYDGRE